MGWFPSPGEAGGSVSFVSDDLFLFPASGADGDAHGAVGCAFRILFDRFSRVSDASDAENGLLLILCGFGGISSSLGCGGWRGPGYAMKRFFTTPVMDFASHFWLKLRIFFSGSFVGCFCACPGMNVLSSIFKIGLLQLDFCIWTRYKRELCCGSFRHIYIRGVCWFNR
jgi:hypothetical protein